jgi:hypothetical protein
LFFLAVFFWLGIKIPYHPSTATQRGAFAHRKKAFFQDRQNPIWEIVFPAKIFPASESIILTVKYRSLFCGAQYAPFKLLSFGWQD